MKSVSKQGQIKSKMTEKAEPEHKSTLDNPAEEFQLFQTAVDFFKDLNLSMILSRKLKQILEGGLVL